MGQLRMALPKGRIFNNVKQLILDSGFSMTHNSREYKPVLSDRDISLKIMKPQNVAELVSLGFHDAGFTGYDWVIESGADVEILLKTGFDPVSIVSAMPSSFDEKVLLKDNPVVATEYVNMTRRYMDEKYDKFLQSTKAYKVGICFDFQLLEEVPTDEHDILMDSVISE